MNKLSAIAPWTAQPLSDASKAAKFREVMSLSAERVIMGRSAIITGWVVGAVGVATMALSIWGWVEILPLKETRFVYEEIDKSTGIVSQPITIENAAHSFGAAVECHDMRRYIEVREGYVPETDQRNDYLTKLYSRADEQARYVDARSSLSNPLKGLVKDGHVSLERFNFHPMPLNRDGITRTYVVTFDRTVWHGDSKDPTQSWTATIDFQYHPELKMNDADRIDNPTGLQVIGYTAHSDTPDQRKQ